MIETKLEMTPTKSVHENTYQLCILKIDTTFFDGSTCQLSNSKPVVNFDESLKVLNVDIALLNGDQTKIQNTIAINNFPYYNAVWDVSINYNNNENNENNETKKKAKPIQMEIYIEPRPQTN